MVLTEAPAIAGRARVAIRFKLSLGGQLKRKKAVSILQMPMLAKRIYLAFLA